MQIEFSFFSFSLPFISLHFLPFPSCAYLPLQKKNIPIVSTPLLLSPPPPPKSVHIVVRLFSQFTSVIYTTFRFILVFTILLIFYPSPTRFICFFFGCCSFLLFSFYVLVRSSHPYIPGSLFFCLSGTLSQGVGTYFLLVIPNKMSVTLPMIISLRIRKKKEV